MTLEHLSKKEQKQWEKFAKVVGKALCERDERRKAQWEERKAKPDGRCWVCGKRTKEKYRNKKGFTVWVCDGKECQFLVRQSF